MNYKTQAHFTKYILVFFLVISNFSCIRSRSWSTPEYKHLYYEVSISPKYTYKPEFSYTINKNTIDVTLKKIKICKKSQTDVERIYLIENTKSPRAKYYTVLGFILSSFAIPSYYMGFFKSKGTSRTINFAVGTGIFLVPGLSLAGYGIYKKSKEFTKKEEVGMNRRIIKSSTFKCGEEQVDKNQQVEILTKFGFKNLGSPINGKISININNIYPLHNETNNVFYLEIYLNKKKVGTIKLRNYKNKQDF